MLKTDIPVKEPSIWETIDKLRINDLNMLAPKMYERVQALLYDCKKIATINGELFDPRVFETARVDALQEIYFQQGTTRARTAIFGWHFYWLAVDIVSKSKEWSVKSTWWNALARLAPKHGLKSGHEWRRPDDPHIYFGTLKDSPSDIARTLYFGTAHWEGMTQFTDPAEHHQGLQRVWKAVGAM